MFLKNLISVKCQTWFFYTFSSYIPTEYNMKVVRQNQIELRFQHKVGCPDRPLFLLGSVINIFSVVNFDLNLAAVANLTVIQNKQLLEILENHFDLTERNKNHFL